MITLRQHIASLIAVFFALIVGILVGVALVGSSEKRESILLSKLEAKFRKLWEENRRLSERVKKLEEEVKVRERFEGQIAPLVLAGRLEGRSIAVVFLGRMAEREALLNALEIAGAKVVGEVEVRSRMTRVSEEVADRAASALSPEIEVERSGPVERAAYALGAALARGLAPRILGLFSRKKLTKHRGSFGAPADSIVIGCGERKGWGAGADLVDDSLVEGAMSEGAYVVACETVNLSESRVPFYRRKRVPTVDNVDTAPGRVALVLVLEGRRGHFGVKPTAESLLPRLLIPQP